ncbi:MAG: polyribonucleotide nucleotidyltransferase [Candidatus Sungbacteria bacterium]|uniref:Polyribonucleotide nucleotidyltransferase n=1 Tax=Candidatus Sungiibacteriota bacterium TaxID=2750080 RepID=A0A932YZB1_9BACT|nr:polyribonucleotide nucleotidyltransferase [Parcubacteria group bacterium]MBI4132939.1 polyribonucleotide nucleotidyltransferase [Candidatus Sungbacteria bacterium]
MEEKKYTVSSNGGEFVFKTGKLALQANASVLARLGGTEVLATVVMPGEPREDIGYFPLMVDYEEKLYAAGKIKGSRFVKHEGRPTDEAILSARLVDRAVRPLFPKWLTNDVQVILTVLSFDKENDPDIVGLNAAAAALSISDVPWKGPIAATRVSRGGNEWLVNPSYTLRTASELNLVVAGTAEKTLMIEADAKEASEETVFQGVQFAQKQLTSLIDLFSKMQKEVGLPKMSEPEAHDSEEDGSGVDPVTEAERFVGERIGAALFTGPKESKSSRKQAVVALLEALEEHLRTLQVGKEKRKLAAGEASKFIERSVTAAILKTGARVDGRALSEIRPISLEVGLLSRTHGSGLFSRGETQILSVVTLDSPGSEQILDTLEENDTKKRYFHHYNFPPFSVGEAGPLRGPGRREIGHGALAEKALVPMLPSKEEFPYTIRVVSEVLGSNGSSSMGSVCGSTLALLNAGVPIKKPVSGIAMGLASDEAGNYKVLTDLQDLEDGPGGMDFKVAGTRDGITAIQLDTKTTGLSNAIVKETLERAKTARMEILDQMEVVIAKPAELSPYAPRITSIRISTDKIRVVIGSGGKTINEIIDACGVEIDIDDDGLVMITSESAEGAAKAEEWIKNLTHDVTAGEKYEGKVTRIMDFGAFVEVLPGKEGLVHISNLAPGHVERVEDVVKLGDTLAVEITEIDEQGRINLRVQGVTKEPVRRNGADRGSRPYGGRGGGRPFRPRRP